MPFCRWRCNSLPVSDAKIDPLLESQFAAGRLYACISSRPGQSGRGDGYILEGKELEVCFAARNNLYSILTFTNSSTSGSSGQANRSTRTTHKCYLLHDPSDLPLDLSLEHT
jgi:hypothetical protein